MKPWPCRECDCEDLDCLAEELQPDKASLENPVCVCGHTKSQHEVEGED